MREGPKRELPVDAIRRWCRSALLWVVATSCCTVTYMTTAWDGTKARDLSFEELVDGVRGDNPEAAITVLQARMLEAIEILNRRAKADDRAGRLARSANQRLAQEANK